MSENASCHTRTYDSRDRTLVPGVVVVYYNTLSIGHHIPVCFSSTILSFKYRSGVLGSHNGIEYGTTLPHSVFSGGL